MKRNRLPFFPVRPYIGSYIGHQEGKVFVQFDCRWLGADGLCTNYERRPETCRHYTAGIDYLCAEHVPLFKGIPVVVERRP